MENSALAIKRMTVDIIYYFLWIIEAILLVRFLFELLGANRQNQIVSFVYSLSLVFMAPFQNIFPPVRAGNFVINLSILVALVVYSIIAYLIVSLIEIVSHSTQRAI